MIDDELRRMLETMRQDIAEVRQEMGQEFVAVRQEIAETRRHIDVAYEATHRQIVLLTEGIHSVREELGRTEKRLDDKIDHSAADTQALIRFSHMQLDQRLRAIEQRA